MPNQFRTAKPESALLKSCIAYYYFDESDEENFTKSFVYYPHFNNALTIYKDSEIVLNNPYSSIARPKSNRYTFGFGKLISCAAEAKIHAPFNRIGIVFQPIGLNHFLDGDLSDFVKAPVNPNFNVFKDTMLPILDEVFATNDIHSKVEILDNYFLSIYKGFHDSKMKEAMDLLFKDDIKYSVEALAEKLKISRKTLLRMFKKHQNCSAIDYIKLIQFRKSIELFQNSKDKTTLTDLAISTAYYDQSDFINHFKKLTGFNPKSFFKNVSIVSEQGTFWTLRWLH